MEVQTLKYLQTRPWGSEQENFGVLCTVNGSGSCGLSRGGGLCVCVQCVQEDKVGGKKLPTQKG